MEKLSGVKPVKGVHVVQDDEYATTTVEYRDSARTFDAGIFMNVMLKRFSLSAEDAVEIMEQCKPYKGTLTAYWNASLK